MEGFEWGENNLDATSPHDLQSKGVNVFFAPNIEAGKKIVDLADGSLTRFWPDQDRPREGYYAEYESLARYCERSAIPLNEIEGQMTTEPIGFDEAGEPLRHGGTGA